MESKRNQAEVEINPKEVIVNNTEEPKEITKTSEIEKLSEPNDNKGNLQEKSNIFNRILNWIKNLFSAKNP